MRQTFLHPDFSWLPDELTKYAGGALTWAIILLTAALIIAACVWAMGVATSNPQLASRGRSTLIACLIGALMIGLIPFGVPWIAKKFGGKVFGARKRK